MEAQTLLLLLLIRRRRRQVKKLQRAARIWINPLLLNCHSEGDFFILYPKLRQDELKFYNYFRMSVAAFEQLNDLLKESVSRHDTIMRKSISAEERIAITIR